MKSGKLSKALDACRKTLADVKTNHAWLQLKEEERRPGDPPVMVMDCDLSKDARNTRFIAALFECKALLGEANKKIGSLKEREASRKELRQMELEFTRLKTPKDF